MNIAYENKQSYHVLKIIRRDFLKIIINCGINRSIIRWLCGNRKIKISLDTAKGGRKFHD
jgi:hypothetical protein